jgi:branched-subunit amino acid aminotransferase/4-amino-4-deoxychorismate lyase
MGSPEAPKVYLNGRLVARDEARISPLDRGFLYGDGFFETTRIAGGAALFLKRHLDRLAASCREAGFGREVDVGELSDAARRLTAENGAGEGYLRITVSRGPYGGRLAELEAAEPTVFIEARPMDLPPLDGAPPITLARSPCRRDETSPLIAHKSLSYGANVLALAEGRGRGADEVYFLNSRGHLTEGAISNLFLVRGGVVRTPDAACGLLPGITRAVVLELCAEQGIPAETGQYAEADLAEAEEAFCTNSLRGLMRVGRVLDLPGASFGGELTRRLAQLYAERARPSTVP